MMFKQRIGNKVLATVVALTAGTLAACVGPYTPPPKEIAAANPTVTYQYANEDALVEVTHKAEIYCRDFNAMPRAMRFATTPDNQRQVIFECDRGRPLAAAPAYGTSVIAGPAVVAAAPVIAVPATIPSISYCYRTDEGLVTATQQAETYCRQYSARPRATNFSNNRDGTTTVAFGCDRA